MNGAHWPSCDSWDDHVGRRVRELPIADGWSLSRLVDDFRAEWAEEQVLLDTEMDPEVRRVFDDLHERAMVR